MRCVVCSSPVGSDEAVFAPHSEHRDLQPYCAECVPPDYPDEYQTDDEEIAYEF